MKKTFYIFLGVYAAGAIFYGYKKYAGRRAAGDAHALNAFFEPGNLIWPYALYVS